MAQRLYLMQDPMENGFFEPPPLSDRNTDITHDERPDLVGNDGRLLANVGILWIQPTSIGTVMPTHFIYCRRDELCTYDELPEEWK